MRIGYCHTHLGKPTVFMDRRIARYDKLARRLVLATPQAYKKFLSDAPLLRRLNEHLNLTDMIRTELLEAAGFEVQLFAHGRAFGLCLPNNKDRYDYYEDSDSLIQLPRELAREYYCLFRIEIAGEEHLTTAQRIIGLHRMIQYALNDREYTKTASIEIEPKLKRPVIYKLGEDNEGRSHYVIPLCVLDHQHMDFLPPVEDIKRS